MCTVLLGKFQNHHHYITHADRPGKNKMEVIYTQMCDVSQMFAFTFRNTVTIKHGDTVSTLHTTEHPNFVCFAANHFIVTAVS